LTAIERHIQKRASLLLGLRKDRDKENARQKPGVAKDLAAARKTLDGQNGDEPAAKPKKKPHRECGGER
jgi:hypothetical protein